jgi:hypothetical protein
VGKSVERGTTSEASSEDASLSTAQNKLIESAKEKGNLKRFAGHCGSWFHPSDPSTSRNPEPEDYRVAPVYLLKPSTTYHGFTSKDWVCTECREALVERDWVHTFGYDVTGPIIIVGKRVFCENQKCLSYDKRMQPWLPEALEGLAPRIRASLSIVGGTGKSYIFTVALAALTEELADAGIPMEKARAAIAMVWTRLHHRTELHRVARALANHEKTRVDVQMKTQKGSPLSLILQSFLHIFINLLCLLFYY